MVLSIVHHRINMPIFQMDDPLRILGNDRVMRDDHDGRALQVQVD